jgi:ketosteroid isomerase-like protein
MSANLDLVRSIYADWERGDFSRADWADPEIEYVVAEGPAPDVFPGLGRMARYIRGVLSDMADGRNTAEEYRELDDGRIFVLDRLTGRGRSSGLQGEAVGARVFEISDGRVTRIVVYLDRDRALADLGLEEQAMTEESTPDLIGLARLVNEAINRRDWGVVESFYAPDAVDVGVEAIGTFEGAAAIRRYYEDLASSLDDFHVETQEIIDIGNGVTFGVVLVTGHPVGSSAEVRIRFGSVASWTEGEVERLTAYMDIDEARAAAERLAEDRG